jgi:hypothetical protein
MGYNAMKQFLVVFLSVFFFASASNGEEWEGKKILVNEREKVISACEEGISNKGYPYVKVKKYCECSVDYMIELVTKYTKEQLKDIADKRGDDNFIRTDAYLKCKHHLGLD